MLDLYTSLVAAFPAVSTINRTPDYAIDIGGGHSTAEVATALGIPGLVSYDIRPPDAPDIEMLFEYDPSRRWRRRLAAVGRWQQWADAQAAVPYRQFSVTDGAPLPMDGRSYTITSFGFMTSTYGSAEVDPLYGHRFNYLRITLAAMQKVLELVAAGKDVDLLTLGRPTAHQYCKRTILMRWRDRKLVDVQFDLYGPGRWDNYKAGVDPQNSILLKRAA